MTLTPDVRAALEEGNALAAWISEQLPGLEVAGSYRHRIPARLFDLALEHHRSILQLLAVPHCSSAFALVRCQFEAFVRAVWLHRCASDWELERFVEKDELLPTFAKLIEAIEQTPEFSEQILSKAKKAAWGPMNGYTHGGIHQISRRLVDGNIEPAFGDSEILEVIGFTGAFALIALGQIAELANSKDLWNAVDERLKAPVSAPV